MYVTLFLDFSNPDRVREALASMKHFRILPHDATREDIQLTHERQLVDIAHLKIINRFHIPGCDSVLLNWEENADGHGHGASLSMVPVKSGGYYRAVSEFLRQDLPGLGHAIGIDPKGEGTTLLSVMTISFDLYQKARRALYMLKPWNTSPNFRLQRRNFLIRSEARITSLYFTLCLAPRGHGTIANHYVIPQDWLDQTSVVPQMSQSASSVMISVARVPPLLNIEALRTAVEEQRQEVNNDASRGTLEDLRQATERLLRLIRILQQEELRQQQEPAQQPGQQQQDQQQPPPQQAPAQQGQQQQEAGQQEQQQEPNQQQQQAPPPQEPGQQGQPPLQPSVQPAQEESTSGTSRTLNLSQVQEAIQQRSARREADAQHLAAAMQAPPLLQVQLRGSDEVSGITGGSPQQIQQPQQPQQHRRGRQDEAVEALVQRPAQMRRVDDVEEEEGVAAAPQPQRQRPRRRVAPLMGAMGLAEDSITTRGTRASDEDEEEHDSDGD